MAILHREICDDVCYEVRSAGRARRLYTNGAFHSQYNPAWLFTSAVWDLLSLPALCAADPPRTVLVLGVGGGTVIHQLNRLISGLVITGVELDPVHLRLAERYFELTSPNLTLVEADAGRWLTRGQARFDYIVDDVFQHTIGDPARPYQADRRWNDLLLERLAPAGMLVQNHIRPDSFQSSLRALPGGSALRLMTEGYDNQVLAWTRAPGTPQDMKQRLKAGLARLPAKETRRLRHRCFNV